MRVVIWAWLLLMFLVPLPADTGAGREKAGRQAFAFVDKSGTRLLSLSPITDPGPSYKAVCERGQFFAVKFLKRNQATSKDTGRATAENFDGSPGDLFRIIDGKTTADGTCLLIEESVLKQKGVVKSTSLRNKTCEPPLRERIVSQKGRAVVNCWGLERLNAGRALALVMFEGKGKDALASLVLVTPQALAFADFPGRDDKNSTWRVDDGGVLDQ